MSSSTSRVLPIPGSPTQTTRFARPRCASSRQPSSTPSSRSRPTNAVRTRASFGSQLRSDGPEIGRSSSTSTRNRTPTASVDSDFFADERKTQPLFAFRSGSASAQSVEGAGRGELTKPSAIAEPDPGVGLIGVVGPTHAFSVSPDQHSRWRDLDTSLDSSGV